MAGDCEGCYAYAHIPVCKVQAVELERHVVVHGSQHGDVRKAPSYVVGACVRACVRARACVCVWCVCVCVC